MPKVKYSEHVRSEIAVLIERGNITPVEVITLRANSWEWEAIVPALDDEALVQRIRYCVANCSMRRYPAAIYEESLQVLAEEAADRLSRKVVPHEQIRNL
jgi:hypothetical protein